MLNLILNFSSNKNFENEFLQEFPNLNQIGFFELLQP